MRRSWPTAACGKAGSNQKNEPGSKTNKADLLAALKESFAACDVTFNKTTAENYLSSVRSCGGETPRIAALYGNIGTTRNATATSLDICAPSAWKR